MIYAPINILEARIVMSKIIILSSLNVALHTRFMKVLNRAYEQLEGRHVPPADKV